MLIFISVLFTIADTKAALSTEEPMEYSLALKRDNMLGDGTIWMNLEDNMLSEISLSQNEKRSSCDSTYIRYLE
jgi:hypothetical protein